MSEDPEMKKDGGAISAEQNTERQEETGRPVSLSSSEIPTDEKSAVAPDAPDNVRMTREEMESRYRNDPRFAMLFDHENDKKEEVWSIKVGGIRLTPKRILILSGFLLIFLLCLGSCLFFAFKDLAKYRKYAQATELFKSGDYDAAKTLFISVLNDDPNKEDAIASMADIYHQFGDWGNEAFFRQRLMRLNPLNPDLRKDFLDTAFRARNFGVIYSLLNLNFLEKSDLPPAEGALFVLSAIQSGHVANGKSFYELKKKTDRDYFRNDELGRFIDLKMSTSEMDDSRAREFQAFLDNTQNSQVRFETITTLLYYYSKRGDRESDERMEELLREAAALNSFAGATLLADYYFSHYRFDDVIKVAEDYIQTKMNAVMPLLLGESYALSGQHEKIPPLAQKMHLLNGRQSRVIASYLDALNAFCEGDNVRLRERMLEAGSTIETPLSDLMSLQIAILNDSSKEIRQILDTIMKSRPFMDFRERARTAALYYLMEKADGDLAVDQEKLNDCAGIAQLIQSTDDDISFLRRIILLDSFNRDVLTEDDLQGALAMFPGDAVLLQIAARYYLLNGRPTRAMEYIVEYNDLNVVTGKSSMEILHMVALDRLGRKAEAEKEFRAIVERGEDDSLLYLYFVFCAENKFIDSLKSLAAWIETLPQDSASRSALPFIRAEILFADNATKDQALDLFEKNNASDLRFVFYAASRLADAGRLDEAIRRYLSLRETYPDKVLLNIQISDLYSKKGDAESSLAFAQAAWQENKNDLQARFAYGKRLFEAGQVTDALSVLKFPQYRSEFPADMLSLWEKVVREQLKLDFNAARYTPVMENAKHLLTCFPGDKEAQEYLQKIENIRLLEKNSIRQ